MACRSDHPRIGDPSTTCGALSARIAAHPREQTVLTGGGRVDVDRRPADPLGVEVFAEAVDARLHLVDLGYTDQAHFTRDFSRVTGTPPGFYLADQ